MCFNYNVLSLILPLIQTNSTTYNLCHVIEQGLLLKQPSSSGPFTIKRIKKTPQSIDDREKRIEWVKNHGTCWNGRLHLARANGGRGFMIILAQIETQSWLTTSNWKLTSRSPWKDFIRYWGFSINEKNMCTHPFDGNDPALSAPWAREHMFSWGKQWHGSVLEVVQSFRMLLQYIVGPVTSRFVSQYNFLQITNLVSLQSFICDSKWAQIVLSVLKRREAYDNAWACLLLCWSNICSSYFGPFSFSGLLSGNQWLCV